VYALLRVCIVFGFGEPCRTLVSKVAHLNVEIFEQWHEVTFRLFVRRDFCNLQVNQSIDRLPSAVGGVSAVVRTLPVKIIARNKIDDSKRFSKESEVARAQDSFMTSMPRTCCGESA
jgi:hypothetical protein